MEGSQRVPPYREGIVKRMQGHFVIVQQEVANAHLDERDGDFGVLLAQGSLADAGCPFKVFQGGLVFFHAKQGNAHIVERGADVFVKFTVRPALAIQYRLEQMQGLGVFVSLEIGTG